MEETSRLPTPLPPPTPPPPSLSSASNPAPPPSRTLLTWLPLYLSRTDRVLTKLTHLASTTPDTVLQPLSYTLPLLTLAPLSLFTPLPPSTQPRILALAALIADYRIFARLWGLLSIYAWAKSTVVAPPKDSVERALVAAQIAACAAYQVLENGAYLASKGVVGLGKRREGRWWVWSARFWAVHVVLELVRLGRVKVRVRAEKGLVVRAADEESMGDGDGDWWREVGVNLAYAPLTLHWSLEGGMSGVGAGVVGLLGGVAGVIGLERKWRALGG